jgi:hypothetical protein
MMSWFIQSILQQLKLQTYWSINNKLDVEESGRAIPA